MNKLKLNNKGFAISSIIYAMLILFLILLTLIMAMLTRRKIAFDKARNEIKDTLGYNNKTVSYTESGEVQTFEAPKEGYYRVELWGHGTSSDAGGSYTQATIKLNQSENIFFTLNSSSAKATLLARELMEAGISTNVKSSITTESEKLECDLVSNAITCNALTTNTAIISPTIILPGSTMPAWNGSLTMTGNKNASHAKITYLTNKTPEVPTLNLNILNKYNCNNAIATRNTTNMLNGIQLQQTSNQNEYRIKIPDQNFSFNYKITSGTVKFDTTFLTGTGNFVTPSAGELVISGTVLNLTLGNFTYNGGLVKFDNGNIKMNSITPQAQKSCTNIASSITGCTAIATGETVSAPVNIVLTKVSGVTTQNYTNQIQINGGEWQNMTNTSTYSYATITEPGRYKVYTRQIYNTSTCSALTSLRNPFVTEVSEELNFTIN